MSKYIDTINKWDEGGYLLFQIPIYDVPREPSNWTDVCVWTLDQFVDAYEKCGLEFIGGATNKGPFSFNDIGPNHHKFQILKKPE